MHPDDSPSGQGHSDENTGARTPDNHDTPGNNLDEEHNPMNNSGNNTGGSQQHMMK